MSKHVVYGLLVALMASFPACSSETVSPTVEPAAPTPSATIPPITGAPANVVALLNLGPRKLPPVALSVESPSLPNDDLREAWRDYLTNTIVADNDASVPIVHLCDEFRGIWVGSDEIHNELTNAREVIWAINTMIDRPGFIRNINNGVILSVADRDRSFPPQAFTFEVQQPQDSIGDYVVYESRSC